jgi:hypothetical protein
MKSKKQSATSSGIEESPLPAPEQRSSGTRLAPDDDCRCDCGCGDEPARRLWASAATRDERSSDQTFPQSETLRASAARQTMQENLAAKRATRVEDRSRHSPHWPRIRREVTREQAVGAASWREKWGEGREPPPWQEWVRPSENWPERVLPASKRCLEHGRWVVLADTGASAR